MYNPAFTPEPTGTDSPKIEARGALVSKNFFSDTKSSSDLNPWVYFHQQFMSSLNNFDVIK